MNINISEAEIDHFVNKLVAGEGSSKIYLFLFETLNLKYDFIKVSDVQLGAWLMATYMRGLKLEVSLPISD